MQIRTDEKRGTGKTYNQIKNAKPNALFVVSNRGAKYAAVDTLRSMGRDKNYMRIFTVDEIMDSYGHNLAGLTLSEVIIDHCIILEGEEIVVFNYLKALVRTPK